MLSNLILKVASRTELKENVEFFPVFIVKNVESDFSILLYLMRDLGFLHCIFI